MSSPSTTIAVFGATGQQGGAVVRSLLKRNFKVIAITRDAKKPEVSSLQQLGATVEEADMDNIDSMIHVLKKASAVFSVQMGFGPQGLNTREIEQGKLVIDAAKQAGTIQHFVYSSVGGAERNTGIPHFDSKWEIEKHLRSSGLNWTVIRPVFFYDNFVTIFRDSLMQKSEIALAIPENRALQMVAVEDIGEFAAIVFQNPSQFIFKSYELAGDEIKGPEIAQAFAEKLHEDIRYIALPNQVMMQYSREMGIMFQWITDYGYHANIEHLKELYPGLQDFKTWVTRQQL